MKKSIPPCQPTELSNSLFNLSDDSILRSGATVLPGLRIRGHDFESLLRMNLSLNAKSLLFASFFASSKAASWPTFQRMSYEAALKSAKKTIKNQNFYH